MLFELLIEPEFVQIVLLQMKGIGYIKVSRFKLPGSHAS